MFIILLIAAVVTLAAAGHRPGGTTRWSAPMMPPSWHYQQAERLLQAGESPGEDTTVARLAALLAVGHAALACTPRSGRRHHHEAPRHHTSSTQWAPVDNEEQVVPTGRDWTLPLLLGIALLIMATVTMIVIFA
jgi:hypothetical protein